MTRRPEFVACYNDGRRYFTKSFIVFVLKQQVPDEWRLGLAVSKKIGSAVHRNRVRRVVRECFRLCQVQVPDGIDVVVVPKRHLKPRRVSLAYVMQEFEPLFRTLGEELTRPAEDQTP